MTATPRADAHVVLPTWECSETSRAWWKDLLGFERSSVVVEADPDVDGLLVIDNDFGAASVSDETEETYSSFSDRDCCTLWWR